MRKAARAAAQALSAPGYDYFWFPSIIPTAERSWFSSEACAEIDEVCQELNAVGANPYDEITLDLLGRACRRWLEVQLHNTSSLIMDYFRAKDPSLTEQDISTTEEEITSICREFCRLATELFDEERVGCPNILEPAAKDFRRVLEDLADGEKSIWLRKFRTWIREGGGGQGLAGRLAAKGPGKRGPTPKQKHPESLSSKPVVRHQLDGAAEPKPVDRTHTVARLREMTGLANTALHAYATSAGVKTPKRGKKNHPYSDADVRIILNEIITRTTEDATLAKCRKALQNLEEIPE